MTKQWKRNNYTFKQRK